MAEQQGRERLDAIVVGAGIAGLTCASALAERGARVRVLDKGRGVGGRCASWRSDGGLTLDYGPTFLHGSDPSFVAALATLGDAGPIDGWPERVRGDGTACQPRAFGPRERRLALRDGVSAWPKALARGLDVRLGTEVVRVERAGPLLRVRTRDGATHDAPDLVLTLPCEQLGALIDASETLAAPLTGARRLLAMLGTVPCLTVLATYPPSVGELDWDLQYPEQSELLKLVSNESSKRPRAGALGLVLQARSPWSRRMLEEPGEQWSRAMLSEAARLLGDWAAEPGWTRAHRWRFARSDASSELAGPMLVPLEGGARVGLAGELFARGAGLEAAWLSGRALAALLGGALERSVQSPAGVLRHRAD